MLYLRKESREWKSPVHNDKRVKFVYLVRDKKTRVVDIGTYERPVANLRPVFKTFYSDFDAYVVRVKDPKDVEKKLHDYYLRYGIEVPGVGIANTPETRHVFRVIATRYDLDVRRG